MLLNDTKMWPTLLAHTIRLGVPLWCCTLVIRVNRVHCSLFARSCSLYVHEVLIISPLLWASGLCIIVSIIVLYNCGSERVRAFYARIARGWCTIGAVHLESPAHLPGTPRFSADGHVAKCACATLTGVGHHCAVFSCLIKVKAAQASLDSGVSYFAPIWAIWHFAYICRVLGTHSSPNIALLIGVYSSPLWLACTADVLIVVRNSPV